MKINYGLVAINDQDEIVHFVGYEEEPTEDDIIYIRAELQNDPEFGLAEGGYKLYRAPQEIVEHFASKIDIKE